MLRRVRTTKNLAKRIDMEYFARPHPMRRWRFILSLAIPLIALIWLGAHWIKSPGAFRQRSGLALARRFWTKVQYLPHRCWWYVFPSGHGKSLPGLP